MAACGIACALVPVGGSLSCSKPPLEMQGRIRGGSLRTNGPMSTLPARPSLGRVVARHGVESARDDTSLIYRKLAPTNNREFETFQPPRWSEAKDQLAELKKSFANGGQISELDMDRLVDALLREEGQSKEDYQRRAIFFNQIAEFFRQGKSYIAQKDESASFARTMQILVDSILAEDGRSAGDYSARAQVFAKSAEVFPFNAEVPSI